MGSLQAGALVNDPGLILAVVGGIAALAGLAVASSSSAAAATTKPTTPTNSCANPAPLPPGITWQLVSGPVPAGTHLRISATAADFAAVTASITNLGTGIQGWVNLLAQPNVVAAFGTANMCAWAPGDTLPPDWPADDYDAQSEYHADFVYQGAQPFQTFSTPFPMKVWAALPAPPVVKGAGAGSAGATTGTTGAGFAGAGAGVTAGGGAAGAAGVIGATIQPTTNPQTVHLTPGNLTQTVNGAAVGAPLTIVIDGGGTFTDVGDSNATVPTALPTLPFFVFTTPALDGVLTLQWTDVNGNAYTSTVNY